MIKVKEEYRLHPVHLDLVDRRVAIGGKITLNRTPPSLPLVIEECTEAEYKELYDSGYTLFFEIVENDVKQSKPKKNKELGNDETDTHADTLLSDTEHSI